MQFTVPPDLESLVQKRLLTGEYATPEAVFRRALEALEAEEEWGAEDRTALDAKIDRALQQFADGTVYSPDEALRKLASLRKAHLAR